MDDPYKTLGVPKTATEDEIRKAYKKLAKKHHPDLNPGNKEAENQFKDISAAYSFLSDAEKRRAYDAGDRLIERRVLRIPRRPGEGVYAADAGVAEVD